MTGFRRLLTCVLAVAFLSTVSCGREGGTVLDPEQIEQNEQIFNVLTGCSGTCIAGFTQMIDGYTHILEWLAAGKDTSDGDRSLNLTTGAFGFDMDMDGRSGKEIQFRGKIDTLTIDNCDDGMVKGEVCIMEWDMFKQPTGAHVGEGTFTVVGMGDVGYPATPSYRVTIIRENTWIETDDGCKLTVHGLGLGLHPFADPQLFSAVVEFKITTPGIVEEVRGGMYYSYDPTPGAQQTANLTGQHDIGSTTTDFSCSINMDTFALDCS